MKTIDTIVDDIQELLEKDGWLDETLSYGLRTGVGSRLEGHFNGSGDNSRRRALRLSQMGPRCPRALWYSIHHPEMGEALPPWAKIKYALGHIVESLALTLAKAAGHEVTGEQDELVLDGIVGHRDCVINGAVCDIKSAASFSFNRFRNGEFRREDTFGYLDQLDGYVLASANDPLVTVKDKGYLLVIDKQLGKMCLCEHRVTHEREEILRRRIDSYKQIVAETKPPACECGTLSEGASGNIRLDVRASYSDFKNVCFPHLRTFIYSNGPVFLSKVVKRPWNKDGPIKEVDQHGNTIY